MIEKSGLDFTACCDFCSETLDTEESDWHMAVEAMKKAGWKVFKKMNAWLHKCPTCRGIYGGADDFEDVS